MNITHPLRLATVFNYSNCCWCIAIPIMLFLLAGCTNNSGFDDKFSLETPAPTPHKIAIINASPNVINSIKYKPCGANAKHFQQLTGNLRPNEKFSINIYSQCVDLMATNAFKKNLVHVKNVDLEKIKTWTIK